MIVKDENNKHALIIVVGGDTPEDDIYAKQCAERNFNRLNSLFGVIDSTLASCEPEEGTWFLQNIMVNMLIRMNTSPSVKDSYLDSMSSMYDVAETHKQRVKNHERY